jgi:hypothetical protein
MKGNISSFSLDLRQGEIHFSHLRKKTKIFPNPTIPETPTQPRKIFPTMGLS